MENIARDRACRLFGAEHANVQPHSGAQANLAVYFALLKPGDTVMGMNLAHGGHLTHGSPGEHVRASYYNFVPYGVQRRDGYHRLRPAAWPWRWKCKPKLIVAGASAYPRAIDFAKFRGNGRRRAAPTSWWTWPTSPAWWPAAIHPNPVPYADVVTTTTHKTLRGPRGGMILCKEALAKAIDKAIFPGTQGGPLMHVIAAKAVCLGEALQP